VVFGRQHVQDGIATLRTDKGGEQITITPPILRALGRCARARAEAGRRCWRHPAVPEIVAAHAILGPMERLKEDDPIRMTFVARGFCEFGVLRGRSRLPGQSPSFAAIATLPTSFAQRIGYLQPL
jgi:hypothetical protein